MDGFGDRNMIADVEVFGVDASRDLQRGRRCVRGGFNFARSDHAGGT